MPSPPLVEMLGLGGFDFAIIDAEHGVFDLERTQECLRAAASVGMPCMVRPPELNAHFIQAALDMGASGIQVPQVDTAADASKAVECSHFPPRGTRGFSSTTRAAGYGYRPRAQFVEQAGQNTVVCVQIESRAGVESLAEILNVPGVNIVFIGTSDLSLSYGLDAPDHPEIISLIEDMVPRIVKSGKTAGVFLTDWTKLGYFQSLGIRYFALSAGIFIREAIRGQVQNFASAKAK